jgi:hypothetical protein
MKTLMLIIWCLGQILLPASTPLENVRWKVSEDSRLEIFGATNVTPFQCVSVDYSGTDVLLANNSRGGQSLVWSGEITMKAANFDCANNVMTRDFRKTVQAEEHPEIKIKFIQLHQKSREDFEGRVEISLAGVSRQFPVRCQLRDPGKGKKTLTGEKSVKFSDFHIDPPVKFLGAVRVKDEVTVNFDLILEAN